MQMVSRIHPATKNFIFYLVRMPKQQRHVPVVPPIATHLTKIHKHPTPQQQQQHSKKVSLDKLPPVPSGGKILKPMVSLMLPSGDKHPVVMILFDDSLTKEKYCTKCKHYIAAKVHVRDDDEDEDADGESVYMFYTCPNDK